MRCTLFFVCIILAPGCFSQTVRHDNWLWISGEVQKEVLKKMEIALNGEVRLNANYRNVRSFFGEAEVTYKLNKYLAGSLQYRYGGRENDVSDFVRAQRLTVYAYAKVKYKKLTLAHRLGYFRQYLELDAGDDRINPEIYWRNRLQAKYKLSGAIEPLMGAEFFFRAFDGRNRIDEWRYVFGFEIGISKRHTIKPLFLYTRQVNVKRPDTRSILSLAYTYSIPLKKAAAREKT